MLYADRPLPPQLLDTLRDREPDHIYKDMMRSLALALLETDTIPGAVSRIGCGNGKTVAYAGMILDLIGSKRHLHVFDAFPVVPIHPDEVMPDRNQKCDHDAGILVCEAACDALGVSTPRHYHPGWFQDTLEKEMPMSSFVYVDVPNRASLIYLLNPLYLATEDNAICLFEGYGLGLTGCVQRQTDAFLNLKPEKMELAVSGITGGFRRQVPKWLKDERAAKAMPSLEVATKN